MLTEIEASAVPLEVARRTSRMVGLHVARGNWHRAFAALEFMQRAYIDNTISRDGSPEQRAADTPITMIGLSPRVEESLARLEIETVADLLYTPRDELRESKQIGEKMLAEILEKVRAAGWR